MHCWKWNLDVLLRLAQRVLWVTKKLISVWALLPWMAGIPFRDASTRNETLMARLTWLRQILLQGDFQLLCLLLYWWREILPCFLRRPCRATGKGHCLSIVSCGTLGMKLQQSTALQNVHSPNVLLSVWSVPADSQEKTVWMVLLRSRSIFSIVS